MLGAYMSSLDSVKAGSIPLGFRADGNVLELEIEGIGVLRNRLVAG